MKPVWESLQEVFDRAVGIAKDRNQKRGYGDSWRESKTGVRGLIAMADHKNMRLFNQLFDVPEAEWPLEEALDSALDAVNYNAFIAILLQERIEARQPWPETTDQPLCSCGARPGQRHERNCAITVLLQGMRKEAERPLCTCGHSLGQMHERSCAMRGIRE